MYVESLEIDNFKSFGVKTKILFDQGFTVISGPNGSGKSNIGDAFLFVLGTRSSKTVRADRLGDLIHNGKTRRNSCSVSIKFSPSEKDQIKEKVEITRIIEGVNGDVKSTYYLNGNRVRHNDIEEFLQSIGLLLDSYGFVLQGDINRIIEMSGIERRKLLESIAGIEGYNIQIEKAKSDMDKINQDISTLGTLRIEIESNMEKLAVEVDRLRKFKEKEKRLKSLKTTYVELEIMECKTEISKIDGQIAVAEQQLEKFNEERKIVQSRISELNERKTKAENGVGQETQTELRSIKEKLESFLLQKAQIDVNVDNLNNSLSDLRLRLEEKEERIGEIEKDMGKIGSKISLSDQELSKKKEELESINEKISSIMHSSSMKISRTNELTIKIKDIESKKAKLEQELHASEREAEKLRVQVESRKVELGKKEELLTNAKYRMAESKWKLQDIQKGTSGKKTTLDKLNKSYYELRNLIKDLEDERSSIGTKIQTLVREVERLSATSSQVYGMQKSVKAILDARNRGEISGIHKTLGELITYDDSLTLAVESAAGSKLNSVVVDNENVAEECISLLKESKLQRATFLPISKMQSGRPRGKAIMVKQSGETMGLLSENIKYSPEYENIIWYAFQDTILVKNIEIAKKHMTGVRIVTLDGDIFESSGAISGGFLERRQRNRGADELRQKEQDLQSLRNREQELKTELSDIKAKFEDVSTELLSISSSGGEEKGKVDSITADIESARKSIESLELEISGIKNLFSEVDAEYAKSVTALDDLKRQSALLDNERIQLIQEMGTEEDPGSKKLSELQQRKDHIELEISTTKSIVSENRGRMNELSLRKEELMKEIGDIKIQMNSGSLKRKEFNDAKRETEINIEKYRLLEQELDIASKKLLDELREINNGIQEAFAEDNKIRDKISSTENVIITAKVKKDSLNERITNYEEESKTIGGTVESFGMSMAQMKFEISIAENEIENWGPVNGLAEEEYTRIKERITEIQNDTRKLQEENESLRNLMLELEERKKNELLTLFRKIRENMKVIYRALSGGGEVELLMSDESDPLNTEIHIRASPKGHAFTKLSSLSGGEKSLTAMAFIMAVQNIKPSPFYYLDEVDMFLDGSNAERIGSMLKANSSYAQVMMISLKKALLKYADSLIGVTMVDGENTQVFQKKVGEADPF